MADARGDGQRRSGAARAIDIALRTAHLGSMATLTGGVAFAVAPAALRTWMVLTFVSGAALLVSEASHSRHWLYQGRGLLAVSHVAALGVFSVDHRITPAAAAVALVIGAVGSHLPRSIRKWSLRHRRIVD